MTVRVHLFARVRELMGADTCQVEIPTGANVAELRSALAIHIAGTAGLVVRSAVAVNGEYAADDRVIDPTDEVALIPPVSGGAV